MKSILRSIIYFILPYFLIATGRIKRVKKKAANGDFILSVFFHNPSRKLFESIVKWFLKNGFHFISVDELYDILHNGKKIPSSAVVFTVDDGWKENKDNIVAVAEEYKIPVTIFITTDPVENGGGYWVSYVFQAKQNNLNYPTLSALKMLPNDERLTITNEIKTKFTLPREALSIDELKQISKSKYITLGSHTISHPFLTSCSEDQSRKEITESKLILEKWLHKDVNSFAYPFGNYNDKEIELLKKANYNLSFSTKSEYLTKECANILYSLPRFEVADNDSYLESICKMTGTWYEINAKLKKASS